MNRYENTRASRIMRRVMKDFREGDLPELARVIDGSYTNMWFYAEGKRKWNLEVWLDVLAALGALRLANNRVVLELNLTDSEKNRFRKIRKSWLESQEMEP